MTRPTTRHRSPRQPVTVTGSEPIEMPAPRHEVHLDADAVGVFEQHRVVAGLEAVLLRRVDDDRAYGKPVQTVVEITAALVFLTR
jgi:hypothetical protein